MTSERVFCLVLAALVCGYQIGRIVWEKKS